jgi:hypothetical protein
MFFPEDVEQQILHNSQDRSIKHSNKPLIKSFKSPVIHTAPRSIGGSYDGVSTLKPAKSSSMSGGSTAKRKPTVWQTLIKTTMNEKGLNMKEAIKFIKENNLY